MIRPTVANVADRDLRPGDVYVGRPSEWGNPYQVGRDGTRERVIALYATYLGHNPELVVALWKRRPLRLLCHCAPLACHADVLAGAVLAYDRHLEGTTE